MSPNRIVQIVLEEKFSTQRVPKAVLREMLAEGIISHLPEGISDDEDDFEPIEITGEPISETIIQERR